MRKFKSTFSRAALNQIYISYVLPGLEYSSVVWDGCSDYNTNTLETKSTRGRPYCYWANSIRLHRKIVHGMWLDNPDQQKSTTHIDI